MYGAFCELKDNTYKAWWWQLLNQSLYPFLFPSNLRKQRKVHCKLASWHPRCFSGSSYLQCYTPIVFERTFLSFAPTYSIKGSPVLMWLYFPFHLGSFHQIPRIKKKKTKQKRVSKCNTFSVSWVHLSYQLGGANSRIKSPVHRQTSL